MKETRYVQSACCTWHGTIYEARKTADGLPGCPHCQSPLFEHKNRAKFDADVDRFAIDHGYDPIQYAAWIQSLHDSGTCKSLKDWNWKADFAAFTNGSA